MTPRNRARQHAAQRRETIPGQRARLCWHTQGQWEQGWVRMSESPLVLQQCWAGWHRGKGRRVLKGRIEEGSLKEEGMRPGEERMACMMSMGVERCCC